MSEGIAGLHVEPHFGFYFRPTIAGPHIEHICHTLIHASLRKSLRKGHGVKSLLAQTPQTLFLRDAIFLILFGLGEWGRYVLEGGNQSSPHSWWHSANWCKDIWDDEKEAIVLTFWTKRWLWKIIWMKSR